MELSGPGRTLDRGPKPKHAANHFSSGLRVGLKLVHYLPLQFDRSTYTSISSPSSLVSTFYTNKQQLPPVAGPCTVISPSLPLDQVDSNRQFGEASVLNRNSKGHRLPKAAWSRMCVKRGRGYGLLLWLLLLVLTSGVVDCINQPKNLASAWSRMEYGVQPFASTSRHRILQPARSFNLAAPGPNLYEPSLGPSRSLTGKQHQQIAQLPPSASSMSYCSNGWNAHDESMSDEGSTVDYGQVLPTNLDGGYRHSTVHFEDLALPRSPSELSPIGISPSPSFASSPSIDLAAPMPSPFFVPPPARLQARAAKGKENVPTRREVQRPAPLKLAPIPDDNHHPESAAGPARPRAKLSTRPLSAGFPYRTHIVQIQLDHPQLSSYSQAHKDELYRVAGRVRQGTNRDSHSSKCTDTSAECDLDISFESSQHPDRVGEADGGGEGKGAVPVHGVPEREMVRSPSGRLLGTKKRVKSAVELRAKYMEDTQNIQGVHDGPIAIMIGAEEGLKTAWQASHGKGPIQRANSSASGGSGFRFNTTNPVIVPLPDSPVDSATFPELHTLVSLPPGALGRTAPASTASPAWSFKAWFGTRAQESAANTKPTSPRAWWIGEAAKSTVSYVKDKTSRTAPQTSSTVQSATFPSPLFSVGGGETPNDTPITVQLEDDDDPAVDTLGKREECGDVLTGLGISFGTAQRTHRQDGGLNHRRRHAAIPSLSITYAHDDALDEDEKAMADISLDGSQLERSHAASVRNNLHPEDHSRSPSPSSPKVEHRFAFALTPIENTDHSSQHQHDNQIAHVPGTPPLARQMVKPNWRASVLSVFSLASWADSHSHDYADDSLLLWETVPPAKLLFVLGFLGMPWLWIIGGWFLRGDGEMWSQRGRRCRSEGCGCGAIKRGWGVGADGLSRWQAPARDGFVLKCKVASGVSGLAVTGLTGVGIWAAVSAAIAVA